MDRSSDTKNINNRLLATLLLTFIRSGSPQTEHLQGSEPPLPTEGVRLYSGLLDLEIPNYGMISQLMFREGDYGLVVTYSADIGDSDGKNDGLWCQSATSNNTNGIWIQPNGVQVQGVIRRNRHHPVYSVQATGQVGLLRPHSISGQHSLQGLYQCQIVDNSGNIQTLVVWIGGESEFDNVDGPVLFQGLQFVPPSRRDTEPPLYYLTFIVNNVPPTYITCSKDNVTMNNSNITREILNPIYAEDESPVSVRVNLILMTRDVATYNCTVGFFKHRGLVYSTLRAQRASVAELNTSSITILVAGTPFNLVAKRFLCVVELSWSAPANSTPPIAGYEVFFVVNGNPNSMSVTNTTETSTTMSEGLTLGKRHSFFVVAYSDTMNTLPSPRSENQIVETNSPEFNGSLSAVSTMNNITVSWSPLQPELTSYHLTSVCWLQCDNSALSPIVPTPSASDTTVIISGLPAGSKCNIILTAIYCDNSKTPANLIATTPFDYSDTLGLVVFETPDRVSQDTIIVEWHPPSDESEKDVIYMYEVSYILSGTFTTFNSTNARLELTGLDQKIWVNLSVRAFTVCETGPPNTLSTYINETSKCDFLPDTLGLVVFGTPEVSHHTITVVWHPPSDESEEDMTDMYEVSYTFDGTNTTFNSTNATLELTGLDPGTWVNLSVRAFTFCRAGPAHTLSMFTNETRKCSFIPDTLGLVVFETPEVSHTTITVVWHPPSDESEVVVTYMYEVNYTLDGTITMFNSTDTGLELTGLDPGTWVNLSVRAFTSCTGGPANTLSMYTNEISFSNDLIIAVGVVLPLLLAITASIIIAITVVVWRMRSSTTFTGGKKRTETVWLSDVKLLGK